MQRWGSPVRIPPRCGIFRFEGGMTDDTQALIEQLQARIEALEAKALQESPEQRRERLEAAKRAAIARRKVRR